MHALNERNPSTFKVLHVLVCFAQGLIELGGHGEGLLDVVQRVVLDLRLDIALVLETVGRVRVCPLRPKTAMEVQRERDDAQ